MRWKTHRSLKTIRSGLVGLSGLLILGAVPPLAAQENEGRPVKVAVIEVQRILTDSEAGKEAIARLKKMQEEKVAETKRMQEEITQLRDRIAGGRLSLAEGRLAEMEKELEEKLIAFRRFQDDADRALQKAQDEAFSRIERQVMPIIDQVGREFGYTLIFNKFDSGLLFAPQEVDITSLVIERFDSSTSQQGS